MAHPGRRTPRPPPRPDEAVPLRGVLPRHGRNSDRRTRPAQRARRCGAPALKCCTRLPVVRRTAQFRGVEMHSSKASICEVRVMPGGAKRSRTKTYVALTGCTGRSATGWPTVSSPPASTPFRRRRRCCGAASVSRTAARVSCAALGLTAPQARGPGQRASSGRGALP